MGLASQSCPVLVGEKAWGVGRIDAFKIKAEPRHVSRRVLEHIIFSLQDPFTQHLPNFTMSRKPEADSTLQSAPGHLHFPLKTMEEAGAM